MFRLREALPNTPNVESFPGVAVSRWTGVKPSSLALNTLRQARVSQQESDRTRRGVVLGRDGRPIRAPEAIYYEMLTCERCGASYPACGWCPFCNPRGNRR
jgi:hypothetical protein